MSEATAAEHQHEWTAMDGECATYKCECSAVAVKERGAMVVRSKRTWRPDGGGIPVHRRYIGSQREDRLDDEISGGGLIGHAPRGWKVRP